MYYSPMDTGLPKLETLILFPLKRQIPFRGDKKRMRPGAFDVCGTSRLHTHAPDSNRLTSPTFAPAAL